MEYIVAELNKLRESLEGQGDSQEAREVQAVIKQLSSIQNNRDNRIEELIKEAGFWDFVKDVGSRIVNWTAELFNSTGKTRRAYNAFIKKFDFATATNFIDEVRNFVGVAGKAYSDLQRKQQKKQNEEMAHAIDAMSTAINQLERGIIWFEQTTDNGVNIPNEIYITSLTDPRQRTQERLKANQIKNKVREMSGYINSIVQYMKSPETTTEYQSESFGNEDMKQPIINEVDDYLRKADTIFSKYESGLYKDDPTIPITAAQVFVDDVKQLIEEIVQRKDKSLNSDERSIWEQLYNIVMKEARAFTDIINEDEETEKEEAKNESDKSSNLAKYESRIENAYDAILEYTHKNSNSFKNSLGSITNSTFKASIEEVVDLVEKAFPALSSGSWTDDMSSTIEIVKLIVEAIEEIKNRRYKKYIPYFNSLYLEAKKLYNSLEAYSNI